MSAVCVVWTSLGGGFFGIQLSESLEANMPNLALKMVKVAFWIEEFFCYFFQLRGLGTHSSVPAASFRGPTNGAFSPGSSPPTIPTTLNPSLVQIFIHPFECHLSGTFSLCALSIFASP